MLVLCSNGLSGKKLSDSIREKSVGGKKAALVVTADNEYKEKNYHVPRCIEELSSIRFAVDLFDLDRQPAELLQNYDLVEFIGGNPFYLLQSVREHHAADVLRSLAEQKILIGWSAAAFVFGPTLELVNLYSPEMNFLGLTDLNGLSLTKYEVLPHYIRFLTKFEQFEEKCRAYEEKRNTKVIRINDGDGVIIDKDEMIVCRENI